MRINSKQLNLFATLIMIVGYFSIREFGGFYLQIWKLLFYFYFGIVACNILRHKDIKMQKSKYIWIVGITILFSLATLPLSKTHTTNSINMLRQYGTIIVYSLSLYVMIDIRENFRQLLSALFVGGVIAAIYQISRIDMRALSSATASLLLRTSVSEHIHVNTHGYNLFFSFAAGMYLWITSKNEKNARKIGKILSAVGVFLIVLGIFFTGARKEIVCVALLVSMLLVTGKYKVLKVFSVITILIISYQALLHVPALYNTVGWRLEQADIMDKSSEGRIDLIVDAVNTGINHPLGVGLDNSRYYSSTEEDYAHNNYAEFFADLGILGFISYYGVYVFFLVNLWKIHRKQDGFESKYWLALFVNICVHDFFQISYYRFCYHLALLMIGEFVLSESRNTKNWVGGIRNERLGD